MIINLFKSEGDLYSMVKWNYQMPWENPPQPLAKIHIYQSLCGKKGRRPYLVTFINCVGRKDFGPSHIPWHLFPWFPSVDKIHHVPNNQWIRSRGPEEATQGCPRWCNFPTRWKKNGEITTPTNSPESGTMDRRTISRIFLLIGENNSNIQWGHKEWYFFTARQ